MEMPSRDVVDGYRQLAGAILLQAFYDAREKEDAALRVEALLWLASNEAAGLCAILGLPDPVRVLYQSGELRGFRARKSGWRISERKRRVQK